jgi:predicted phage tail protein
MKRKIYLEGELGDKFGKELSANVSSLKEAFKLIDANYPGFKDYLFECDQKGVGFAIDIQGDSVDNEEDFIIPLNAGDITIASVPAGSKSGLGKILAAIAIIYIVSITGGFEAIGTLMKTGTMTVGAAAGMAGFSIGMSLAMAGLQQLMAPDPSVDEQSPQSYMFNGDEQNIIEGDPVPILYGELRVPGRPIAFSALNGAGAYSSYTGGAYTTVPGWDGNLNINFNF